MDEFRESIRIIRQALDGTVVVDNLREQTHGRTPGGRGQIDRRLRVPRPDQDSADASDQGKDMTWTNEIAGADIAICEG